MQLATMLYNAMLENNCSEHASRMSAMENSSKSAGEILGAPPPGPAPPPPHPLGRLGGSARMRAAACVPQLRLLLVSPRTHTPAHKAAPGY